MEFSHLTWFPLTFCPPHPIGKWPGWPGGRPDGVEEQLPPPLYLNSLPLPFWFIWFILYWKPYYYYLVSTTERNDNVNIFFRLNFPRRKGRILLWDWISSISSGNTILSFSKSFSSLIFFPFTKHTCKNMDQRRDWTNWKRGGGGGEVIMCSCYLWETVIREGMDSDVTLLSNNSVYVFFRHHHLELSFFQSMSVKTVSISRKEKKAIKSISIWTEHLIVAWENNFLLFHKT